MEHIINEQEIIDGNLKKRLEDCYAMIKVYEREIELIREECKHVKTEYVNYMWAPGHISPNTLVCSTCGKVMPRDEENLGWQSVSSGLGGDQYDYLGPSQKEAFALLKMNYLDEK